MSENIYKVDAHFEDIQSHIKICLQNAKKSIKIAVAYFTDKDIFNLLCSRAIDDVEVELLISDEDVNFKSGDVNFDNLIKCGGKLFISVNEQKIILHNKFCIIDE